MASSSGTRKFNGVVHRHHTNPDGKEGGWVAETAKVDPKAWVEPNARVSGAAHVGPGVKIRGHAVVQDSATVKDGAVVEGSAVIQGDAIVARLRRGYYHSGHYCQ